MDDHHIQAIPAAGTVIIADLEYTTWEGAQERGWSDPGEFREIVQIGAVRADAGQGFAEIDAFSALIRPTINPVLSDYFTGLTGITNDALARGGTGLAPSLAAFVAFSGDDPILSHGRDDRVIAEDCALKDLENPFTGRDWLNVNPPIHAVTGKRLVSSELPAHFGLQGVGQAHDALADARALARVLGHLRDEGRV